LFNNGSCWVLQLFSINLINPSKKSEDVVRKLRGLQVVNSVRQLTEQVLQLLKAPTTEIQLGYYEPGHGTRAKKRYITDDEDIEEMKNLYEEKKEVLLWCYDPFTVQPPRVGKRKNTNENDKEPKAKSRLRFENALEKNDKSGGSISSSKSKAWQLL